MGPPVVVGISSVPGRYAGVKRCLLAVPLRVSSVERLEMRLRAEVEHLHGRAPHLPPPVEPGFVRARLAAAARQVTPQSVAVPALDVDECQHRPGPPTCHIAPARSHCRADSANAASTAATRSRWYASADASAAASASVGGTASRTMLRLTSRCLSAVVSARPRRADAC